MLYKRDSDTHVFAVALVFVEHLALLLVWFREVPYFLYHCSVGEVMTVPPEMRESTTGAAWLGAARSGVAQRGAARRGVAWRGVGLGCEVGSPPPGSKNVLLPLKIHESLA